MVGVVPADVRGPTTLGTYYFAITHWPNTAKVLHSQPSTLYIDQINGRPQQQGNLGLFCIHCSVFYAQCFPHKSNIVLSSIKKKSNKLFNILFKLEIKKMNKIIFQQNSWRRTIFSLNISFLISQSGMILTRKKKLQQILC